MKRWTLDDIPWDQFDPSKVHPELLKIIKAASLVEFNGAHYAEYLERIFKGDQAFVEAARQWGTEEVQHGQALARWAEMADPNFNFEKAFEEYSREITLPDAEESVRGSRMGELVSRCTVETGTSSYYSALAEAADEPVLKVICQKIAGDEFRHFKLFYSHLKRYQKKGLRGKIEKMRVVAWRIFELEDDELPYAYYAANDLEKTTYQRRHYVEEHAARSFACYRYMHVERALAMNFKAVGLKPYGRLNKLAARLGFWFVRRHFKRANKNRGLPPIRSDVATEGASAG